jgi:hypothetical protein
MQHGVWSNLGAPCAWNVFILNTLFIGWSQQYTSSQASTVSEVSHLDHCTTEASLEPLSTRSQICITAALRHYLQKEKAEKRAAKLAARLAASGLAPPPGGWGGWVQGPVEGAHLPEVPVNRDGSRVRISTSASVKTYSETVDTPQPVLIHTARQGR